MKGALRATTLATAVLAASTAWAQTPAEPAPAEPAPAEPTPAEARQPVDANAPGDPVWARYHDAFDALARGEIDRAREILRSIVALRAGHPAEQRAAEILAGLDRAPAPIEPEVEDVRAPERKTKLARAELASWQTIMGIAIGVELCFLAECDDPTSGIGTVAFSAGAALAISLFATRDGITSGDRGIWNSGATWGLWNGLALAIIAEAETDLGLDATEVGMILLGGHAAGYGVAALVALQFEPSGGQVALANTVGVWSGVLTQFAMVAFGVEEDGADHLKAALVASDVGLVAGAFLARALPMSRGRTLLIDAGGILGMLAGFGTAVLIGGDDLEQQAGFAAGLAGTSLGLAGAIYLTRDWDAPPSPARVTIVPTRGGAVFGVAFDL